MKKLVSFILFFVFISIYSSFGQYRPWPSQEYPFDTEWQSQQAYWASLERMEAVRPFKIEYLTTDKISYNIVDYGMYTNYPFLTYLRFSAVKDNIAFSFLSSEPVGLTETLGLFDSYYFDYPKETIKSVIMINGLSFNSHVPNRWNWIPLLWKVNQVTNWVDEEGKNWLNNREFSRIRADNEEAPGYETDTPRFSLSTVSNGLRNMHSITNLNYSWVYDSILFLNGSQFLEENMQHQTQTYHSWSGDAFVTNLSLSAYSTPYLGFFEDIGDYNFNSPNLLPDSDPPEWWLDWNDFHNHHLTMPYWVRSLDDDDLIEQETTFDNVDNPTDIFTLLTPVPPNKDLWGIILEPNSTNIWESPPEFDRPDFYVKTIMNSTTGGPPYISKGSQRLILPRISRYDGFLNLEKHNSYKLKWQEITDADGYYIYVKDDAGSILAFTTTEGRTATSTILDLPAEPPTPPIYNTEPKTTDKGFRLIGINNFTETSDRRIFNGYNHNMNYNHTQVATYYTPPSPWYMDRHGMVDWTHSYEETPYSLASNQWFISYNRNLNYWSQLFALKVSSWLFKQQTLPPTFNNISHYVDWWCLVQPEFAINTNHILRLMHENVDPNVFVEMIGNDINGEPFVKTLPSDTGPWSPILESTNWNWISEPVGDSVCFYDADAVITNETLVYTNWYKATIITATNQSIDTNIITDIVTQDKVGDNVTLINPTNQTKTVTPGQVAGDFPNNYIIFVYIRTIVNYDDGTEFLDGGSQGLQILLNDTYTVNTGNKLTLSWNDCDPGIGTTRYGVFIGASVYPPAFIHYIETNTLSYTLAWADINGGNMPSIPNDIHIPVYYTVTNITERIYNMTNTQFTCQAMSNKVEVTYYQQLYSSYCDGDTLVNDQLPPVEHFWSTLWTNELFLDSTSISSITNTEIHTVGTVVWTNTYITNNIDGSGYQWCNERWIPADFNDLEDPDGIKQQSIPFIYADPEMYAFNRWYQTYDYSNTSYSAVTTGMAYNVNYQYKFTLNYLNEWHGSSSNIISPLTIYDVNCWKDFWQYTYPPYFEK